MTNEARYNLQHNVAEDIRRPETTYNVESSLDRYILSRIGTRNKSRIIIDEKNLCDVENQIADDICQKIKNGLKPLIK